MRQREAGTPGQENPGADRGLGTIRGRQRGQPDKGSKARFARGNPRAATYGMGGKHRREVAAGRQERRPGGRLFRDRAIDGGKEAVAKIERSDVDG